MTSAATHAAGEITKRKVMVLSGADALTGLYSVLMLVLETRR